MSDATKIGDELHELVQGRIPATRTWQREIYLGTGQRPASENKWWGCNAAEARFAQLRGDLARVRQILDFTASWVTTHPFTEGEELTPEEVYRGLMGFGAYTLSGVALATGHPGYRAILEHTAAHPGWCLLPAAPGPGLAVVDHRLGRVGQNVVLVGDGRVISDLPYVAQAGMRGWVRRRDKGSTAEFLFADRRALSMIVAQAAGMQRRRSVAPNEFDRFEAIREAFTGPPGSDNEQLPSWGFTPAQQQVAQAFLADPTDTTLLVEVVSWLRGHAPSLPFRITRFVNGSVFMQLLRSRKSSTDCVAGDGWFRVSGQNHGVTMKMSAGTGARSGAAGDDDVKPMRGWEDATAWYCQDADGGEPAQSIAKPAGLVVAWTVDVTEDGRIVARDGAGRELGHGAQPHPPAPPATPPVVSPPGGGTGGGRKRRKGKGCAIFLAIPPLAALAWVLA